MLRIKVCSGEAFDEESKRFIDLNPEFLDFEHSLVSLSKWESKHEKPFLSNTEKTSAETLSYINCMALDPNITDEQLSKLTQDDYQTINDYINAKMTATWFRESSDSKRPSETITAELIYYWMLTLNIDWEAQHWHLTKLLTLIRVCNEKNAPKKKMSRAEMAAQRRALNEQRRAKFGSKG